MIKEQIEIKKKELKDRYKYIRKNNPHDLVLIYKGISNIPSISKLNFTTEEAEAAKQMKEYSIIPEYILRQIKYENPYLELRHAKFFKMEIPNKIKKKMANDRSDELYILSHIYNFGSYYVEEPDERTDAVVFVKVNNRFDINTIGYRFIGSFEV